MQLKNQLIEMHSKKTRVNREELIRQDISNFNEMQENSRKRKELGQIIQQKAVSQS